MTIWHELLTNVAIVSIVTSLWIGAHRRLIRLPYVLRAVFFGALMAAGTVGVMLLPVEVRPGVFIDLRYTFLSLAGFFGGPIVVVVPAVAALILRLEMGGAGMIIGVPAILLCSIVGLTGFRLLKGRIPDVQHILALGFMTVFTATAGFTVFVPIAAWPATVVGSVGPLAILLFISTTGAAFAMAMELRHQHTYNESRMYRAIIEALPDCLNAKDLAGRFIAANPATAELMMAETADMLIGKTDFDFYDPDTAHRFKADEVAFMAAVKATAVEQRFTRLDGTQTWLSTLKAPLFDENGILVGLITHNREITEQKKLEMRLAETQARLSNALSSMADGMVMFDRNGTILFSNDQYRALFPKTSDLRVAGSNIRAILQAAEERGEEVQKSFAMDAMSVEKRVAQLMQPGDRQIMLADGRFLDARARLTEEGHCLIVFSDITHTKESERQLLSLNRQLEAIANTDGLTGLLNRRAFDRVLEEAIRDAVECDWPLTLLLVDIDRFKAFNDTYGHPAGDACLRDVATCLKQAVSDFGQGSVARYGGEEIGIILPHLNEADAFRIAELLRVSVKSLGIEHLGSEKNTVTISIGVAAGRARTVGSAADFLRLADEALYVAKAAGRDRVSAPEPRVVDAEVG